ncbi:uncharacterized protein LOC126428230 [Schistocerca serialis cubense]|uniref:uncharacterized protein LOC126428230 n=1 Tax=Schistocerca serialis cubense TaxID=2023355 RepID=UPI00214DFCC9|nr:uncharacterized protein LOC126428230 [Schistocerca serialis cubense]
MSVVAAGDGRKASVEERRSRVHQELQELQQRRHQQRLQRAHEQRELRDMLAKYSPWGKPGCGAPNPDGIRKRKMRLDGLFPDDEKKGQRPTAPPVDGPPRASPSPSPSGGLRRDPLIHFQAHETGRRCVDNLLRYRQPGEQQRAYKQQLDNMVAERRRLQAEEERRQKQLEAQLLLLEPPWGRPGPGGALWRHPRTVGLRFLYSLGWTDNSTLRTAENQRYRRYNGHNNQLNSSISFTSRNNSNSSNNCLTYNGHKEEDSGGVELVPLLTRRRPPQAPRHPLASTDVTRVRSEPPSASPRSWLKSGSDYIQELSRQVTTKQQEQQRAVQEERESSRKHHETWRGLWGRPGHGAPREVTTKANLDTLLRQVTVK